MKIKKDEYIALNKEFLQKKASESGIRQLPKGILYRVIREGKGNESPRGNSIVGVHYTGRLINGKTFDSTSSQGYPAAFRLNQLIEGWIIALKKMHVGDKWEIYVPAEVGYGYRSVGRIPGGSTLVFEIELVSIN